MSEEKIHFYQWTVNSRVAMQPIRVRTPDFKSEERGWCIRVKPHPEHPFNENDQGRLILHRKTLSDIVLAFYDAERRFISGELDWPPTKTLIFEVKRDKPDSAVALDDNKSDHDSDSEPETTKEAGTSSEAGASQS